MLFDWNLVIGNHSNQILNVLWKQRMFQNIIQMNHLNRDCLKVYFNWIMIIKNDLKHITDQNLRYEFIYFE